MLLSTNNFFESCIVGIRLTIKVKSTSLNSGAIIYSLIAIKDSMIIVVKETKKR